MPDAIDSTGRTDTLHTAAPTAATNGWCCPVCSTSVPHPHGPGRKRVYCSNACKQRAYRWRCANGIRTLATPWTPAQRSGFLKAHAVRTPGDPVGQPVDRAGRQVTLCGAFAQPANPRSTSHTEYVPGGRRSCRSCANLIGADESWATEYPPGRMTYVNGRWDWVPNPPDQRRRDYFARLSEAA